MVARCRCQRFAAFAVLLCCTCCCAAVLHGTCDAACPGSPFRRLQPFPTCLRSACIFSLPSFDPQAFYEARFGQQAWGKLDKIPKEIW